MPSPSRCEKCAGRMNVYTTRRSGDKIVRTKHCSKCGHRIRTEERVVSANAGGRNAPPRPRPAA